MRARSVLPLLALLVLGCGAADGTRLESVVVVPVLRPAPVPAASSRARPEALAGPRLIPIAGATFAMGSEDGDANEAPVHRVTVRPFAIDETEVTVEQYAECVRERGCVPAGKEELCTTGRQDAAGLPVNCVAWEDARAFCAWADKRLPTEEEWELAARGREGRTYPWGEEVEDEDVCFKRGNDGGPCPVASLPRSRTPEGVFDLTGNLWEWTSSSHCPYPEKRCDTTERVNRGGCWQGDQAKHVRGTIRYGDPPERRDPYIGFRCAK